MSDDFRKCASSECASERELTLSEVFEFIKHLDGDFVVHLVIESSDEDEKGR